MTGNTLLTVTEISDTAAAILQNEVVLLNLVTREDKPFTQPIGTTYQMRVPERVASTSGRVAQVQDITQSQITLTIDQQPHQAWKSTVQERTLSIYNYAELILAPRMGQIAADIEKDLAGLYTSLYNSAGTVGTTPNTFAIFSTAPQMLDLGATPQANRFAVLGPFARWGMADALKGLLDTAIVEEAVIRGSIGKTGDMQKGIYMSQSIRTHTVGTFVGTPLIKGASQSGATLDIDGWTTADFLNQGDVFTIAGVYKVNPQTRVSTGQLQHFVVTAKTTESGGEMATLPISPSLTATGISQNVSATPADDAAITILGTTGSVHEQSLVGVPDAIAVAMVDQDIPPSAVAASKSDYKGIRVMVSMGYDVINHQEITRVDCIYGRAVYRAMNMVRLWG